MSSGPGDSGTTFNFAHDLTVDEAGGRRAVWFTTHEDTTCGTCSRNLAFAA